MIKGVNKNAVIVKGSSNEIFEEAIFIVKPEAFKNNISKEQMISKIKDFLNINIKPKTENTKK